MSPGSFLLITSKEGFERDTTGVFLNAGSAISEDIQLSPNIGSLAGKVTDKSGNALKQWVALSAVIFPITWLLIPVGGQQQVIEGQVVKQGHHHHHW